MNTAIATSRPAVAGRQPHVPILPPVSHTYPTLR